MNHTELWDSRFLHLAKQVSYWSKDPSSQVGAVIVDTQRRVRGLGYNGFPRGVDDSPERYADRNEKYPRVVHAEANAILNSQGSLNDCTIYCTHPCCANCAGLVIQSGIKNAVFFTPQQAFYERLKESLSFAESMFREAGVQIWFYDSGESG